MSQSDSQPLLWLDVLPVDVGAQIAVHISNGKKSCSLLALAECSSKQHQAVVSSFERRYAERAGETNVATWRQLFLESDLVEVDLRSLGNAVSEDLCTLLKQPTVRKVTMTIVPVLLAAMENSPSIVDLCLIIGGYGTSHFFLETLQTLPLEKLTLQCESKRCCFAKENRFALHPAMFVARCPRLASLEIDCYCRTSVDPIWSFVLEIPSLHSTKVHAMPPNQVVDRLSTFRSIKFYPRVRSTISGVLLAKRVPLAITELSLGRILRLSARNVAELSYLPNLTRLICTLRARAEVELVDFCRNSPALRTLELTWDHASRSEGMYCVSYDDFARAAEGYVLRLVESAPSLANLALRYVKILTWEIKAVMRRMSSQLEMFRISTFFQEEDQMDRLLTILECALEHNCNLHELQIENPCTTDEKEIRLPDGKKLQMIALLSRLRRRQPRLVFKGLPFEYPL